MKKKNSLLIIVLSILSIQYTLAQEVQLLHDIFPNESSEPQSFAEFNGKIYFTADDGVNGFELWEYDGINAPSLIMDILPGGSSSWAGGFTTFNGEMYFSATDGVNGKELWKYDGVNSPVLVADINPGSSSSDPDNLMVANGTLFFTAKEGSLGRELWSYDGVNVPQMIADINPGPSANSSPNELIEFDNKLFFTANDGTSGTELWSYDFVNAPVQYDINPTGSSSLSELTILGNKLVFAAYTLASGEELWEYDGINAPVLVHEINPGNGIGDPEDLTVFNGKVYFGANDGTNGYELWEYDGVSTPVIVHDINPTADSYPYNFTVLNNELYFQANDGSNGSELWVYDGTNSPSLVYDIEPGAQGSWPEQLTAHNGKLYFSVYTTATNQQLWSYDGTAVTEHLINPSGDASISEITSAANILIFSAYEDVYEQEPWVVCDIDTALSVSGITLTSNEPNATYQWIDCSTLQPISGETNDSFTPTANGDYAVVVNTFGCTDTSACHSITSVGITELSNENALIVSPNPTSDKVTINWSDDSSGRVSVVDLKGQTIFHSGLITSGEIIDLSTIPAGAYFVKLNVENGNQLHTKLIIKK